MDRTLSLCLRTAGAIVGVAAFGLAVAGQRDAATERAGVAPSASLAGPHAGAARIVAGIDLRWCPPGQFRLGSPADEPGRRSDEGPVDVTLTHGFWIGTYEVTQGQWRRTMGELPGQLIAGKGDLMPVYWVSFVAAEEFCARLTAEASDLPAGWEFRLPTEAQWEYACRADTTTAYANGATLAPTQANFGRPFRGEPPDFPRGSATPVGSFPPNAWGIHDMHGNEWEWCRDYFHPNVLGGTDPDRRDVRGRINRDGSSSRVRRGGGWPESAPFCRSAARLPFEPERSSNHIGFRVVLVRR